MSFSKCHFFISYLPSEKMHLNFLNHGIIEYHLLKCLFFYHQMLFPKAAKNNSQITVKNIIE